MIGVLTVINSVVGIFRCQVGSAVRTVSQDDLNSFVSHSTRIPVRTEDPTILHLSV